MSAATLAAIMRLHGIVSSHSSIDADAISAAELLFNFTIDLTAQVGPGDYQ